jgi:hypothetical protein
MRDGALRQVLHCMMDEVSGPHGPSILAAMRLLANAAKLKHGNVPGGMDMFCKRTRHDKTQAKR